MVKCSVNFCQSKSRSKLNSFQFPLNDHELCGQWIQTCCNDDPNWTPTQSSRVCEVHFTEVDFEHIPYGKTFRKKLRDGKHLLFSKWSKYIRIWQNFGAFFDVGWRPFTSQVQPEVNANFNFQALYHLKIFLREPPWSWQWWVIVLWQWWVIARTPSLTFPEFSLRLSLPMERTMIPWNMSHTKISTGEPTILYCKAWRNSNVLNL